MTLDLFRHDFILSIKPEYATEIVAGRKKVELRRRFPDLTVTGAKMYVYASAPIQAIIGYATIDGVERLPIDEIWRRYHKVAFIDRSDFDAYFSNADLGFVLLLREPVKLRESIGLSVLKEKFDFTPPQSFAYADEFFEKLVVVQ